MASESDDVSAPESHPPELERRRQPSEDGRVAARDGERAEFKPNRDIYLIEREAIRIRRSCWPEPPDDSSAEGANRGGNPPGGAPPAPPPAKNDDTRVRAMRAIRLLRPLVFKKKDKP